MSKQGELFGDPGPADRQALEEIAGRSIPRTALLGRYLNLLKSTDLFVHGYSVSHWIQPTDPGTEVLEFNPRTIACVQVDLPRVTATSYEEQVAIHRAIGARVVGRGERYL